MGHRSKAIIKAIIRAIILALAVISATAVRADTAVDLPYRIGGDGRVSTDVFVEGQGPFSFLLDTASSRTMLFEHLRQQLGLAASGPGLLKVYAMNNIGTALPVKPRELRLADQRLSGLTLGVLPDEIQPPQGVLGADGILGMDALSNYFLVMDHDTLRLKLMDPADPDTNAYRKWPSAELTPYQGKDMDITLWWLRAKFGEPERHRASGHGVGHHHAELERGREAGHQARRLHQGNHTPGSSRCAGNAGTRGAINGLAISVGRPELSRPNGDRGQRRRVPLFRTGEQGRRDHRPGFVARQFAGDRFQQAAHLYRPRHARP